MRIIELATRGVDVDYDVARGMADLLASKLAGEVMPVAWYDGKAGKGYPDVKECTGDVPGWLAYAQSHGGDVRVNLNGEEFVFIYCPVG